MLRGGLTYSHVGKRLTNEDKVISALIQFDAYEGDGYSLYATYDGHGSEEVSSLLQRRLLPLLVGLLEGGADFSQSVSIGTCPLY